MKIRTTILIFSLLLGFLTSNAKEKEHLVERGQSLRSIAETYNITEQELIDANPGVEEFFYTGMMLTIPETSTSTSTRQNSVSNQVPTNTPSTPRHTQRTYAEPTTTPQEDNEEVEPQKREFRPVNEKKEDNLTSYTSSVSDDEDRLAWKKGTHEFGYQLEYDLNLFKNNNTATYYKNIFSMDVVVRATYYVFNGAFIEAQLGYLYNSVGVTMKGYDRTSSEISTHAIILPIHAGYSIPFGEKVRLDLLTGPVFNFPISIGMKIDDEKVDQEFKKKVTASWDFGLRLIIGGFNLGATYNLPFSDSSYRVNSDEKDQAMRFYIGFSF